jgi:hypothetical protein
VLFGIPAFDGELVVLVQQQPLLSRRRIATGADEHKAPAQFVAGHVDVNFALGHGPGRIVGLGRRPGTGVPHDDVAAAVLAGRYDALEVDVLHRMVLDMEGRAPHSGVQRRTLRHGPTHQHTVDLQSEVVVQPPGPVSLHHEAARRPGAGAVRCT